MKKKWWNILRLQILLKSISNSFLYIFKLYYVYFSLYMFLTDEKQESLVVVVVDYFYKLRFYYSSICIIQQFEIKYRLARRWNKLKLTVSFFLSISKSACWFSDCGYSNKYISSIFQILFNFISIYFQFLFIQFSFLFQMMFYAHFKIKTLPKKLV